MISGDTALQSEVLEDLAEAVNYRRWLCELVRPWLGDEPLEVGSGSGDYAAELAISTKRFTASEADASRLDMLRRRFERSDTVMVRKLLLPTGEKGEFTSVVSFNVLEHLPDDVAVLRDLRDLLAPGGKVVAIVPAFEFAMGRFDREIGHQRRYRKRTLRRAALDAGLVVERIHYVNSVGLLSWFVVVRLLRMRPKAGTALRMWDRWVIPVVRRLEARRTPPFGQSLLLVASPRHD